MRSHLDTRISRPWHTRTFAKTERSARMQQLVGETRRAHPDGNDTGWQPGDPIPHPWRAARRRLSLCPVEQLAPATSPVPLAARIGQEKSLRIIENSMIARRAASRPAATNGYQRARTGTKEARAVSRSREGGGRGAHGRRALAAEEEMAESRQSVCGASQGATAVPAYRSSPMRLAIVVEDLYPEGGGKISHLHHANEKSDGQQGSLCKSARRLHREVLAPWDELLLSISGSCSDRTDPPPFRDIACSLTAQNLAL
jgi:hypothetical protein